MVSIFGCFDECCEKKSVCGKFIVIKLANVAFFLYLCSRNRFKLHNTYQTIRNRSANHRDNKKKYDHENTITYCTAIALRSAG